MFMCIILIIIVLIIALLLQLNGMQDDNDVIESVAENHREFSELNKVDNRNQYYTIKTILNKYYANINYFNATLAELGVVDDTNEAEIKEEYTATAIKALGEMIDTDALEYLNLNKDNIPKIFEKYKNTSFKIQNIYYKQETVNTIFYYADIMLDYKNEVGIVIKTDLYNGTFSIFPEEYIKNKGINENSFENEFKLDSIEYIKENDSNTYNEQNISDKAMAQNYLYDYGDLIIYNMHEAYSIIDESYKEAKFPTYESFKQYIDGCPINFSYLRLEGYRVKENEDETIYTCQDQYGNIYIIKEKGIMDYTIQLDNYTLENEEFIETYAKATLKDRGILNIDKFFKMINMQDFTSAYNVLDENFRQNNFPTQALFENYIKGKLFRYNKVDYKEYSNEISSIHSYKIGITDATGENTNQVELNVLVKLLNDTNFVMSFEVN